MASKTPFIPYNKQEEMIILVQQHPGLYDQTMREYRDQVWTANVWNKIAVKLDVEGLTGAQVKEKWRNKRDNYRKKRRSALTLKSGSAATDRIIKGPLFEQMAFLDPYIADRETISNIEDGAIAPAQENDDDYPDDKKYQEGQSPDKDTKPATITETTSTKKSTPSSRAKRRKSEVDLQTTLQDMAKQGQELDEEIKKYMTHAATNESDFFLMIGRRVQKLSPRMQQWMEEEVWNLYLKARRQDNAVGGTRCLLCRSQSVQDIVITCMGLIIICSRNHCCPPYHHHHSKNKTDCPISSCNKIA